MRDGIRLGTIVDVFLSPPHDPSIGKFRPAVVLGLSDDSTHCVVVAVSSRLDIGDENWFVPIPHSTANKCNTGLETESVAKVYWHDCVPINECKKVGFVKTKTVAEIKKKYHDYQHEQTTANKED